MRFSVLALALVVTAATAIDAKAQLFGRRRHARECCAPAPVCCQPAAVAYGGMAPQYLPGTGTAAMVMPMPTTEANPITPTGGVQAPGYQPGITTAQATQPTPPGGQPVYGPGGSMVVGGDCCCGAATGYDTGHRRRGMYRRGNYY
jgi:hypothetical protein